MKHLHAGLILVIVVLVTAFATTTVFAIHAHYTNLNTVVPNVSVAGIDLSGMDSLAANSTLQTAYDEMISAGITVAVGTETESIDLFQMSEGSDIAYNLIEWDPAAAATEALSVGHSANVVTDSILTLYYELFGRKTFTANVTVNEDRLVEAILAAFPDMEIDATQTDFSVSISRNKGIIVTVEPGSKGQSLNLSYVANLVAQDARDLHLERMPISTTATEPNIYASDAEKLIDEAVASIAAAPYTVTGTNSNGETEIWTISQRTIADWIRPNISEDGDLFVDLEPELTVDFLTELHAAIDIPAQNARFAIEGEKVTEFQASTDGTVVDDEAFFVALNATLGTDTSVTPLAVTLRTETPSITTQNVNSLGITDLLGEATTDFPHSTAARRSNIKHGAEKLNGVLIAPGEIVSILDHLKPLTIEDGYLPELVIKGDEIKPEVGGGLCQIGTTSFRAAMNAGFEIVERRNHSLAISYYNDATNGNPGTDATLYNPAPDLKFKNDMATYVLLVTTFDNDASTITFSFWGTSDGRKGSYEPPTVLSRIPVGATQYKTSTDLAPGVEQCQNAFPGYTTTFDYNVTYGDGTTKTTEFFSSYRALPKICLVGAAASESAFLPSTETLSIAQE
jgi:vancomycin resistance protein YoaR